MLVVVDVVVVVLDDVVVVVVVCCCCVDFEMKRDPLSSHIRMGGYTLFKKFVPCSILHDLRTHMGEHPHHRRGVNFSPLRGGGRFLGW